MKNYLIILALLVFSGASFAQTSFNVNPTKSIVKWRGKKIVGGDTEGTILISKGQFSVKSKNVETGEIHMDTKSITSEKAPARLVAHLKNEDFFDVEKFPVASFVITEVKGAANNAQVTGKITIKGITETISFPTQFTIGKDVLVATAKDVKVNRTKFGVKYRSGSIFSGLGDGAIEDNFVLDITIVAEIAK